VLDDLTPGTFLYDALAFVREEAPGVEQDSDSVRGQSTDIASAAASLKQDYASDSGNTALTSGGVVEAYLQSGNVVISTDVVARSIQLIDDATSGLAQQGYFPQLVQFENVMGPVFTTSPFGVTGGDGGGQGNQIGIVDALENAATWAFLDTEMASMVADGVAQELDGDRDAQLVQSGILQLDALHRFWSLDGENSLVPAGTTGEPGTATQWALRLNEQIQSQWDGVLGGMLDLSGRSDLVEISDRQAALSAAVQSLRFQLGQAGLSGVPTGAGNLLTEYRLDAAGSSNPAAAAALAEMEDRIGDVAAQALASLEAAHEAFIEANEARSMGQKLFFNSVGNQFISEAAEWADRANKATSDIVGAARLIGQSYYQTHESVREAGLLPAVLNNGRDLGGGIGTGGGTGTGSHGGGGGGTPR